MVRLLMSRPRPDALERKQSDIVLHDLANARCDGGKMHRLKSIAAIAGVLSLLSLAPASSEDQPTAAGISDQKLDQAAAAMTRVNSLHKSYQQKLTQTAPGEQDRVIAEANNALQKAVTDQGLSVDEYNTIVRTAQNDPAVRDKLVQRLGAQKD
jgi:uncharacterized protein DUF4168